jgi:TolB-like protein
MRKVLFIFLFFVSFSVFAQEKPIMTVLDFVTNGVSKSEMRSIISFLSSALFKTDKFILIDIQERDSLLREMEFSMSGCSDETCLLEIGRLLSAQYIVTGNIGRVGSRYVLAIKMLETETGRTMSSSEGVYASIDEIVDDLYNIAAELSENKKKDIVVNTEESDIDISDNTIMPGIDDYNREIKARSPNMAVGAGAGVTIPLGDLNKALDITFTPLVHINFLLDLDWVTMGYGLLLGYQFENTTEKYPDPGLAYQLTSMPLALHTRFSFDFAKPFFFLADASLGFTINNIDYKENEQSDFVTLKLFVSPGVGAGMVLGSNVHIYVYNNIFLILFDNSIYAADSIGLGVQLSY